MLCTQLKNARHLFPGISTPPRNTVWAVLFPWTVFQMCNFHGWETIVKWCCDRSWLVKPSSGEGLECAYWLKIIGAVLPKLYDSLSLDCALSCSLLKNEFNHAKQLRLFSTSSTYVTSESFVSLVWSCSKCFILSSIASCSEAAGSAYM